ncbi:MAG: hypothetical protein JST04_02480 [Bdellovibrionales bacterium]|nr:hypothetical protein [Bdellovibrionales bacterium]
MLESRSVGLRCVVLSVFMGLLLPSVSLRAEDAPPDLPPPPESGDTGLTPIDGSDATAGAELPPPPGEVPPTSSANAGDTAVPQDAGDAVAPPDAASVETPPGEVTPDLTMEGDPKKDADDQAASNDVPSDSGLTDVPVSAGGNTELAGPSEFSSSSDLKNVSMSDRIKSKDLVLWLSLGPSYAQLTNKGSYAQVTSSATGSNDGVGGLGYNAGIGFMVSSAFQFSFDFTGTPKTRNSTVDNAMFGFGPRLGFLYVMGTFGVQQGPDPTTTDNAIGRIFAIGARGGLDLVLSHAADSRMSIGISPEVFLMTPQGVDGYTSVGASVSLRLYGYENAF